MQVNTADILLQMFKRLEELIRENEMLRAEIKRLKENAE